MEPAIVIIRLDFEGLVCRTIKIFFSGEKFKLSSDLSPDVLNVFSCARTVKSLLKV